MYPMGYKTFEDYSLSKWGWARRYAYNLIEAADVVKSLPDDVRNCAQTESENGNYSFQLLHSRLYRADFPTFEDYCKSKWGWTKQHAYRLIECAPIAKSNPQVTSINQARELAKAPPEYRAEVSEMLPMGNKPGNERQARELAETNVYHGRQPAAGLTVPKGHHSQMSARPRLRRHHQEGKCPLPKVSMQDLTSRFNGQPSRYAARTRVEMP